MMLLKVSMYLIVAICGLYLLNLCTAEKILLFPLQSGTTSRLRNLEKMADILTDAGHSVAMLRNDRLGTPQFSSTNIKVFEFIMPEGYVPFDDPGVVEKMMQMSIIKLFDLATGYSSLICDVILKSDILKKIKYMDYDLLIADYTELASHIVSGVLKIPTIAYANEGTYPDSFVGTLKVGHPVPWAITPMVFMPYSDSMTFVQRLINTGAWLGWGYGSYSSNIQLKKIITKYSLNISTDTAGLSRVCLVLSNNHIALDYPR
ncbi:unnamed protein product, partial [Owenia fusiformis]